MDDVRALALRLANGEDGVLDDLYEAIHESQGCPGCKCSTIGELRKIEVCKGQRTAEWKLKRRHMVTASESATVLGQNPYETANSLLKKKLGLTTFHGNKFTQHGQTMESAAIERYETETGHTVESFGLLVSPNEPWLGGSPDGITRCGRLIEVKCPVTRPIVLGEVPRHYMAQMQQLLHITGLQVCDFVEMKGPEEFQIVEVKRDSDWWRENKDKLQAFHKRLEECFEDPSLAPRPRKRKKKAPKFDFG